MDLFELALKLTTEGETEVQSSLKGVASAARDVVETFTGLAALAGVGLGFKEIVSETIAAQYTVAQLNVGLQNNGRITGQTAQSTDELAEKMMKLTTNEADVVKAAESLLITFTNVRGEAFEKTIVAAADLSAHFGYDLPAATRLLGRALEDPERGMMLLRRQNIIFSESEREAIKTMQDAGDIAGAQGVILNKVETAMHGAAAAAKDTLGGAFKSLQNELIKSIQFSNEETSALKSLVKTGADVVIWLRQYRALIVEVTLAVGLVGLTGAMIKLGTVLTGFLITGTGPVAMALFGIKASFASAALAGTGFQGALVGIKATFPSLIAAMGPWLILMGGTVAILEIYRLWKEKQDREDQAADDADQDRVRQKVARMNAVADHARKVAEEKIAQGKRDDIAEEKEKARIETLTKLWPLEDHTAMQTGKMADMAAKYEKAATAANISDERKLVLLERAKSIRDALDKSKGDAAADQKPINDGKWADAMPAWLKGFIPTPEQQKKDIADWVKTMEEDVTESLRTFKIGPVLEMWGEVAKTFKDGITKAVESIGPAISASFTALFSGKGIGGALAAGGKSMLRSLGSIFTAMGEKLLMALPFFKMLQAWAMNPLTAAWAIGAAAVGLMALGAAMGAAAGGGGGGGGSAVATSGFVGAPVNFGPTTQSVNPAGNAASGTGNMMAPQSMTVNVIGPNDPTAQRQILELINNAQRR